jgi:RecA-family ATPase
MSLAESYDGDPDPFTIDPRPCSLCGLTIDQHIRVDTPEGPEFKCDAGELEIQASAKAARLRMELADPRDCDLARIELGIDDSDQGPPVVAADLSTVAAPLQLVCPPAWRDVPLEPMRWLATNRIPADDATILSGDGGGGKTTVALQLAVSVERGLGDWLGTTCETGPVIFFSAEEPDHEMRRRLHRVARKRGLEPNEIAGLHFHFASPESCLLAVSRADGTMWPTPLFGSLSAAAADIRPALIVVDSIAATFGGNQNDRVHARTFVSMFRRLAQDVGCAVLLLDHPSLSGITAGTGRGGSMDWQNATRARLHLETVQGSDGITGRVLEVKKSNYGPVGDKVTLQWEDGCFVMESSEAGQAAPYRAAAQQTLDDLFLRLLEERNAQGRWVTPNKAAGYAPKELAAMQGAGTVTALAFAHAMERLLTAKRIAVETFGPPSKQRQRLIATLPTTLPTGN